MGKGRLPFWLVVRSKRERLGFSQYTVAAAAHISRVALNEFEQQKLHLKPETVQRIMDAIGALARISDCATKTVATEDHS